ncbi:MAG: hypothetical protein K1X85_14465 [Ignavibacteria bacterium]|nr:hypothetical protein [Ignavibacteria bacterium]
MNCRRLFLSVFLLFSFTAVYSSEVPYSIEIQRADISGAPRIHSFAFAQSGGKWLFIGGRINGMHGFTTSTSFPKEFSNTRMYVLDPSTGQTWSRSIFADLPFWKADQFRSTNMQYYQVGNKLYFLGGYGYDSTSNALISFPLLKVIDVAETIDAIMNGSSTAQYIRELNDPRFQVTGGELTSFGDFFFLVGGHKFMGPYRRNVNNQTYTKKISKFRINDNGVTVSISDYTEALDSVEYHRRDMNVVPAVKPDGVGMYSILYGGVFRIGIDLPYLTPIYIDSSSITVDYSFEQKMSQYTCAYMSVFNSGDGGMHTTLFAGMSLNSYNESTNTLELDSLVPFINDITTISRRHDGSTAETIMSARFDSLVGSNAKFILDPSVPAYPNGVIKLRELSGRTFAGYVFGGIKGRIPNGGPSFPSELTYKVYITPDAPLPVELTSFTATASGRNALLSWSTASELNNYGFEIERRSAGSSGGWITAGFVNGAGNSNAPLLYSFEDRDLSSGRHNYRLKQIDNNGSFNYHELSGEVVIGVPEKFFLHQNYPNPFNPSTKLNYDIPSEGRITLAVYDSKGSEIARLENSKPVTAGFYTSDFRSGEKELASGVYYAVLTFSPSGPGSEMKATVKMAMLK